MVTNHKIPKACDKPGKFLTHWPQETNNHSAGSPCLNSEGFLWDNLYQSIEYQFEESNIN